MTRSKATRASTRGSRRLIVSASADARIAAARAWLAAVPRAAEVMVLAPHPHAAHELVRDDVVAGGSRFGIQRFTVDQLAARLAAPELARRGVATSTSLSLAAVATRAIHALLASARAGRFAEVARRPGFPHAVVRTLEELRAEGLSPARLRAIPRWGADLAAILERVEGELIELKLADRAEVLTQARAVIELEATPPIGTPALLLDLSLERKIDADLIAAVASRAPDVIATAPIGDSATIARLEEMLVAKAEIIDDVEPSSLADLKRHLFEETGPAPRALDASVTLMSWPGEARECVEIARRIQAAAAEGVPFDRMAILLRAPTLYRAHVEEALRRAAIPSYFARGATRPDPAGRAFLTLLACAAEGLSARRFAEYLSLAQVPDPDAKPDQSWSPPENELMTSSATTTVNGALRVNETREVEAARDPDAPVIEGSLRAPWRWENLIVEAAVIGGRDRWQRRLDGLASELELRRKEIAEDDARAATLARTVSDLEHLRAFALPLIDRLSALPAEASWAEWLEHLRALAGAAIRQPTRVLAVLAELEPLAPVGPVDLTIIQHVLTPRLRELSVDVESRPQGAVFVAPVEMARGLAFEIVFVLGLAEKVFPQRIVEDPLLPDEARRAIDGATIATQDSRVRAERMALRLAIGGARKQAVLSWPRIDLEQARPRVPSFYALETLRAAEGRLPGFDELRSRAETGAEARLGWPAPDRARDAIDDVEYDLAVLAHLLDADPDHSVGAANYLLSANPHLARALRTRGRRWLKRWTISDGLVDPDDLARESLERHQMGARSFSPTALENFASCPYRFLLQAVHRLQPRDEAEALETIDPLTRGALFHEVQFEVLTALREGKKLPLDPDHLEHAIELLDQAVQRVAAQYEDRLAPAIPRVWLDGVNAIRADLREWLRRSAENADGWVPHRFELSFGLADRQRAQADQASAGDPVPVLDRALLRGSIDLVERRANGTIRVTDHKTGKVRAKEGTIIGGGHTLQPVLYALVAEKLLQASVESGRLYYCTADGDFTERVIELNDESRRDAAVAIDVVGAALEQGFLPAVPEKDACVWCDYRIVCGPNEENRTGRKPKDRLADLERLRKLP